MSRRGLNARSVADGPGAHPEERSVTSVVEELFAFFEKQVKRKRVVGQELLWRFS